MIDQVVTRRDELEAMFQKYPYVPKEVIVQEDLYRLGEAFTEEALKLLEPYANKPMILFSYDREEGVDTPLRESRRVPYELFLTGGIYGLRGITPVNLRINRSSPYIVDVVEGKVTLCERSGSEHVPIALIGKPYERPDLFNKRFEDGVRYGEIALIQETRECLAFTPFRMCQYWGAKEECRFCDINKAAKEQKRLGLRSDRPWFDKVEQVAQVVEDAFLHTDWPEGKRPRSVFLTGGQILTKVDGLTEDGFYLRYIEAIRERIGNRWPICLQTAPKTKDVAKRYRDAGVTAHETNIEVWDERLFNIICPGKAKYYGYQKWLKLMLDEVDVFGEGDVSPCMVIGVEMSQPWGFKTVAEAVKSTSEGFEYMMSHGVVPRPIAWAVEGGSALGDNVPPPLEYFILVDLAWYEIWTKYRLPPVRRYNVAGGNRDQTIRGWQRLAAEGIYKDVTILQTS